MLTDLRHRLASFFRRTRVERELDAELRFHFEHHVSKLGHDGLAHNEAVRQARLAFGSPDSVKEEHRDARAVASFGCATLPKYVSPYVCAGQPPLTSSRGRFIGRRISPRFPRPALTAL